ncbi:MAG: dTDP-4-dehydrorhamnose 3,5-epimerase family protein [Terracidiphilus sp.]
MQAVRNETMNIEETILPGLLVLLPKVYRDDRGAFSETFNLRHITDAGLPTAWVQDNFFDVAKERAEGDSLPG